MSAPTLTETGPVESAPADGKHTRRSNIIIEERICIPAWVDDLESFRRWARSDEFPERGWFSYLNGEIWVDLSMEELFSHNQVKMEFTAGMGGLIRTDEDGYFLFYSLVLMHSAAGLS